MELEGSVSRRRPTARCCFKAVLRWPLFCTKPRTVTVLSILCFIVLVWTIDAIAQGALFDIYIADLARRQGYKHPNEFVGLVESVRGLTSLMLALPLGYLSDKFDRFCVLRCIVCSFGALAVAVVSASVLGEHLRLICVGVALHAVCLQACISTFDAVLADVVPAGPSRTIAYVRARALGTFARALGPGLQATLLSLFGGAFVGPALGKVLLCGYFGMIPLALGLWPLRLPSDQDDVAGIGCGDRRGGTASLVMQSAVEGAAVSGARTEPSRLPPKHLLVPGLITAFNLTFMVGGGITLKFFPLFYHDEYSLSEKNVCWIMAVYWVLTACGAQLAAFLPKCPRPVAVLSLHLVGALLLFAFIAAKDLWLNLLIFEFRPLAINSHFALNAALMMDYALPVCFEWEEAGKKHHV